MKVERTSMKGMQRTEAGLVVPKDLDLRRRGAIAKGTWRTITRAAKECIAENVALVMLCRKCTKRLVVSREATGEIALKCECTDRRVV